MTGAGSMLVLEWLYNELPSVGQERDEPYDTPPQRLGALFPWLLPPHCMHACRKTDRARSFWTGHALASMCISIVISAVFQLFILRTPARRKLRLQIADVTFALSSYNTLLQSNVRYPPLSALRRDRRPAS
jgi:hypothetical protein